MEFRRKLTIPMELKEMYPLTPDMRAVVDKRKEEIRKLFTGEDPRFVMIIGPCSADNEDSVLDYVTRLKKLAEKVEDKIYVIPRVYTGKPRTTGSGYKGILHQPNPEERPDVFKGIVAIRELHMRVLNETGFTSADEMLYPDNYRYLDDILGYVAVGARSVENQEHRLVASGIDVPVGMKNPTSGDLSVMMNAIQAGQHPHTFIYRGWEVHSEGNPLTHTILRGYTNKHGESIPNYHYEDLEHVLEKYEANGNVENPCIIVDTNHANSGKKYLEQSRIAMEIVMNKKFNADIDKAVRGLMVESYLEDGAQKIGDGVYGKSITDPCLGWEKTERLVLDIADRL